ncbi:MAG: SRPBCC domain-containing protein [bacterium]|nr:SRPBCC domain-containing protein [bacterium]
MQKLNFSIEINAPVNKVWDIMLDDETYRVWTSVFTVGSHINGSWDKGSKIQFLAPDENGKMSGMTSMVIENIHNKFISIQHLGVVSDGVEDLKSKAAIDWRGFENYTFTDRGTQTELIIEVDVKEEYKGYFVETWPKALEKLKDLAEN